MKRNLDYPALSLSLDPRPMSSDASPQHAQMAANIPDRSVVMQSTSSYTFPNNRLRLNQTDPTRKPLVLVACGSFSPITYLHLRMFEMAADFARDNSEFEVVGGYLSPVSDFYQKSGLASSTHRLRMCELAVNNDHYDWVMVDNWEAIQPTYMPTAKVLDHVQQEIDKIMGGVRVMLLAGADLIQTMSTPGVWSEDDLDRILRGYGTFIVERSGTDIDSALSALSKYKDGIFTVQQLVQNDVSSTKIRLFLRRGMSVRYLIPAPVIDYIDQEGLYIEDGSSSIAEKGKSKDTESSGRASPVIDSSAAKS